jgi:hypothetical protein
MARRTLVAIGALGALVAPAVTVGALAQQSASVDRPSLVQQVQRLQARGLLASGTPARTVQAAWHAAGRAQPGPTVTGSAAIQTSALSALNSLLLAAGDMNGDGVGEVLDARYHPAGEDSERLVLFCRSGASGAVLWKKVVAARSGHVYLPLPQLLGAKGLPGVVINDVGSSTSGKTVTVSVRLVALDESGVKFWSHKESGTIDSSTNAEQHVPIPAGLDTFQSDAQDVLIGRYDSPGGEDAAVTMQPIRVRGRDGTVAALGAAVTSTAGSPSLADVPDLSGDGLADTVVVVPGSGDGTGVFARRGIDGSQIWTNTSLTVNPGAIATPVGDVHASASGSPDVDDVAVSTGSPTGGGLGLPLPFPDPTAPGEHGQVALLDGASGTSVWAKDGDSAYPVLQAGKPLKPATGVVMTDTESDDTTTTATTTLTTYDDAGEQVYASTYKASTTTSADGDTMAIGIVGEVGDFDADGSTDGLALVLVTSGENSDLTETLFLGKDGSALKTGAAEPLGGSTTGDGDNLVVVKTHHGIIVSMRRGSDNTVLWRNKVVHSRGVRAAAAFGMPMHDTSTCADVLVVGDGPKHAAAGLLTAKGKLEWVVRYKPGSKDPGTVFRPDTAPNIPHC